MALISGGILVLVGILGHDFSGHNNRLALISVDIISGVYCKTGSIIVDCLGRNLNFVDTPRLVLGCLLFIH